MGPIILLPFRKGRRAEDFYRPLKIRRLRPGLNPRTWVPLHHRSRYIILTTIPDTRF
jgi:hypothetical protein